MKGDTGVGFIVGICAGAVLLSIIIFLTGSTYVDGYKDGQVEALTGKVKYELVEHKDKTISWERIEDNE